MTITDGDEKLRWLGSFLAILVHRCGGELTIERLSDYAGMVIDLDVDIDTEADSVTLRLQQLGEWQQGIDATKPRD